MPTMAASFKKPAVLACSGLLLHTTILLCKAVIVVACCCSAKCGVDAIRQSERWKQVPLCVVQKSVQELIHAGMLQAVNKVPGPGLQVGSCCARGGSNKALDGPLF